MVTGAAAVAFVLGAHRARRGTVSDGERRLFHAFNSLPASLHVPVWAVMQLGSFGGVVGAAAAARAQGRTRLAHRLAWVGAGTWLSARAVKHLVQRQRPVHAVGTARVLGREQRGLGYPSGHAAVATALVACAAPDLPARQRALAWVAAAAVGPARMYVGAHLPLDVAGGVAFGLGFGTACRRLLRDRG